MPARKAEDVKKDVDAQKKAVVELKKTVKEPGRTSSSARPARSCGGSRPLAPDDRAEAGEDQEGA